jgi:hypothetical protein
MKVGKVRKIQQVVCDAWGIELQDMLSNSRKREIIRPKHEAIAWVLKEMDLTSSTIARLFGYKDHTTIVHVKRKMEADSVQFKATELSIRIKCEQVEKTPPMGTGGSEIDHDKSSPQGLEQQKKLYLCQTCRARYPEIHDAGADRSRSPGTLYWRVPVASLDGGALADSHREGRRIQQNEPDRLSKIPLQPRSLQLLGDGEGSSQLAEGRWLRRHVRPHRRTGSATDFDRKGRGDSHLIKTQKDWWKVWEENRSEIYEIANMVGFDVDAVLGESIYSVSYKLNFATTERMHREVHVFLELIWHKAPDIPIIHTWPGWSDLCDLCSEYWVFEEESNE